MFDKDWKRIAATEINPDLYLERAREIRRKAIGEICGMLAVVAMGAAFVFVWLAYEGWITPDMFR